MKAPFPWFGGKSRVAEEVWARFGDTPNYVEPFAGSLAVLLDRPTEPQTETVNDKDCYLADFWRAVQADAAAVAKAADWPINEADLHARHKWLVAQSDFREKMRTDPDFFDPKIAGWWVWGICQWIGSGWCREPQREGRFHRNKPRGLTAHTWNTRPSLNANGQSYTFAKRPAMKRGGCGVHRTSQQLPQLGGDGSGSGRGIHSQAISLSIADYMQALQDRLRRVRVCCGDWQRVLGPSPTFHIGLTGIFLDPPYSDKANRDPDIYNEEDLQLAHRVREWAIQNGENPKLRIALCGLEEEHPMPPSWSTHHWKAGGGFGARTNNQNRFKERIWFSPHCLQSNQPQLL